MSRSEAEIKRWLEMKGKYASGKWRGNLSENERMKIFNQRLNAYKASLVIGREFQESSESFLKRKDLKKFYEWDPFK